MEINKIYNENCLETMAKMPHNFIDLIVTSPPYYNAKDYSQYESVDNYMREMKKIFSESYRITKESRMCVINISCVLTKRINRNKQSYRIPLPFYFVPMMEEIGFEFLEDIIWEKPDGSASNRNAKFSKYRKPISYKPNLVTEYILVFKKPATFLIDKILKNNSLVGDGYERTNIWKINPKTKSKHPAPFPDKLVDNLIKYYSYKDDLIYDPFMGSGTTAKVAKINNRNFIGSEIKKQYCDISHENIA